MLSSLLKESYTRAHRALVAAQQLVELEEIVSMAGAMQQHSGSDSSGSSSPLLPTITRAATRDSSSVLSTLRNKWADRLTHLGGDLRSLRRTLAVRSLLLSPKEDEGAWVRLAGICRRQGHWALCANVLRRVGAKVREGCFYVCICTCVLGFCLCICIGETGCEQHLTKTHHNTKCTTGRCLPRRLLFLRRHHQHQRQRRGGRC